MNDHAQSMTDLDWTGFHDSNPPSVSNVPLCVRGFPDAPQVLRGDDLLQATLEARPGA